MVNTEQRETQSQSDFLITKGLILLLLIEQFSLVQTYYIKNMVDPSRAVTTWFTLSH